MRTPLILPVVDYAKIPQEYAGKWVLIHIATQEVISSGDDPITATGTHSTDDLGVVLTSVPGYFSPSSSMDRAIDFYSKGCGFDSLLGCQFWY